LFVVHNFRDSNTEKEALDRWQEQVVKIYTTGRPDTKKVLYKPKKINTVCEAQVHFLDSPIARHLFIANKNTFGASYNLASLELLKGWIEAIPRKLVRNYLPLEMIRRASNDLIVNYLDNVQSIELNHDYSFLMTKENEKIPPPQLKGWKRNGFTISFDPEKKTSNRFDPRCRFMEVMDNESRNKYFIYMDLPGMERKDIKIVIKKTFIVVSGKRIKESPKLSSEQNVIETQGSECEHGEFERTLSIDSTYETKPQSVVFEKGLLIIELHKWADTEVELEV